MILSICMPTYNRPEQAIRQFDFLMSELNKMEDWQKNIEFLISDNHSEDKNYSKILNGVGGEGIKLYRNESNLGLIGNIQSLSSLSKGKYIWFVGDDDVLFPGLLLKVMKSIKKNVGLIFINHNAISDNGEIMMKEAFNNSVNRSIHHVFRYSQTTMMFLTACVYKKCYIDSVLRNYNPKLSTPFLASLYAAEIGGIHYIEEIMINNSWDDISWLDKSSEVFLVQVPLDLVESLRFSQSKLNAAFSIFSYIRKNGIKIFLYRMLLLKKRFFGNEKQ